MSSMAPSQRNCLPTISRWHCEFFTISCAPVITTIPMCNGLQWKWLRTAINEILGPDYLHLSIPSGRDSVQLRLLLSSWDCNRRRWDHITCDSPELPSSACLYARGSI